MRFCVPAVLLMVVTLVPGQATAGDIYLDLSGDRKITRSVAPQELRFILINRLPKATYSIAVLTKLILVPPLPAPTLPKAGFSSAACDDLRLSAEGLDKVTTEKEVGVAVASILKILTAAQCTDPPVVQLATAAIASTVNVVDGSYPVSYGTSVTVVITRGVESWEFVFDGGSRGEWLTTYGLVIGRGDDQTHFSKAAAAGKFAVTAEAETEELKLIPSVYYTWLDRRFANRLFSPGITAGLGLKENAPAVFAGASILHNWNLQFAIGVTISKHDRLRGQYAPGQELAENLTPEQINEGVFRPSLGFVVSFRFGGNPWGSAAEPKAGEAEGETAKGAKPEPKPPVKKG